MSNSLFAPLLSYILWVMILYVLLSIIRAPSIWGDVKYSSNSHPFFNLEKRASANLSNQFEWLVLFYVICIIIITRPELYQHSYLSAAWVFVIGRVLHSVVQIFTTSTRLRGGVFNINFLAVLFMWGTLALDILS